jgi:rRNA-processing protein FCF1
MQTALLDTNALMMPVEVGVRLFEEVERVAGQVEYLVPAATVAELDALSEGAGEAATAASVGRDLVERCRVVDHAADSADNAVVELADGADVVVTNDGPLRDRVLDAGVPVISLRGQHKLAVTQP